MHIRHKNIVIVGILLSLGLVLISCAKPVLKPAPDTNDLERFPVAKVADDIQPASSVTTTLEQAALALPLDITSTLPIPTEAPAVHTNDSEDGTSQQPSEPIPNMPILTEAHQGFTYRPGQVVTILTAGFKPGDSLEARLIHAEQGQIAAYTVSPVSPRGNVPVYLPVESQDAATHPDGAYTLLVSGSDGTQKEYTFSLDYRHLAEAAPFEGCGIYPEPVLDSIVFVWCAGYEPHTSIDIRGLVDGEELFADVVDTIYLDGVALYVLDIFDDDPAGEWRLEIGQDVLTFEIGGK